jgi:hypothetical protein
MVDSLALKNFGRQASRSGFSTTNEGPGLGGRIKILDANAEN